MAIFGFLLTKGGMKLIGYGIAVLALLYFCYMGFNYIKKLGADEVEAFYQVQLSDYKSKTEKKIAELNSAQALLARKAQEEKDKAAASIDAVPTSGKVLVVTSCSKKKPKTEATSSKSSMVKTDGDTQDVGGTQEGSDVASEETKVAEDGGVIFTEDFVNAWNAINEAANGN